MNTSTSSFRFFASCAIGLEPLLEKELSELKALDIQVKGSGVEFSGDIELAMRVCLWSRLANRVFLPLGEFVAKTPEQLYAGALKIEWPEHFDADKTFAISAALKQSDITHSHYTAQVIKDAVVDLFNSRLSDRPSVQTKNPDIRLHLWLHRNKATISLDLSGESLHKRGYRVETVQAPLKENLAAALLLRAGWPDIAKRGGALYDPMCGSATFLIEAAMMAGDIAPNLQREQFGFTAWKHFNASIWQRLQNEARYRADKGKANIPPIMGSDISIKHAGIAKMNIKTAQLSQHVKAVSLPLDRIEADPSWTKGLFISNPPHGERLGDSKKLVGLYQDIGHILKARFAHWQASIFTPNKTLALAIPLKSDRSYQFLNGAIPCRLYNFTIESERFFDAKHSSQQQDGLKKALLPSQGPLSDAAKMLVNRLKKNQKKLKSWVKQESVHCYRLYDADIPEFAIAIDLYHGEKTWVHVQEYQAPASIDADKTIQRLQDALAAIPEVIDVPQNQIFLKVRRRQKGAAQYEKQGGLAGFHPVQEGKAKLLVNLKDYLDTGLFLDHRTVRQWIAEQARDKRFLNLFAYTASATVHAALGGATRSVSVDLSNTYLDWARNNFELNKIDAKKHALVRANCTQWLDEAVEQDEKFELILIDPPTFSNSKRLDDVFDVQRDHVELILKAAQLLTKKGTLFFSTNFRQFKLNADALHRLNIENISTKSIPKDFERNQKIHYCWKITHQSP